MVEFIKFKRGEGKEKMKHNFSITRTQNPKTKPDQNTLRFGRTFTDHMFQMEYDASNGWHNGRIIPYGPISLEPSAMVFHYAQEMFEGLKAYRGKDGRILLFRPDMNAKRMTTTNDRLCIPHLEEDLMIEAIKAVVDVDCDWVPEKPGTSLYIRPFIIADDPYLGVAPSSHFLFMIILSPVGPYYAKGLVPTKIFVEDEYVRAAPGGTGNAKIGANYAIGLKAQVRANEKGYEQVLWLDAIERKYVEEIGTSNAFFYIDDEIITPPLGGSILSGITRASVIELLKNWGYTVSEKKLSIQEVYDKAKTGQLKEVWATGTATVISPVGELCWKDEKVTINKGEIGSLSQKLYDEISGLQSGAIKDTRGWVVEI